MIEPSSENSRSERDQASDNPKLPPSKSNRILKFVSERLLNLATLATFFSVAGYFVVHTYLDKLTGIFTYQVAPVVYISAGVNMVLGVIGGLLTRILPTQLPAIFTGFVSLLFVFIFALIIYWVEYSRTRSTQHARAHMDSVLKHLQRFNFYLFLISVAILAALLGFVYGYYGYEYSPRALGGGMPATVVLVFKPTAAEEMAALGLPLSMNPNARLQSEPLTLLMELSDGVLVRDPQQGIPVIIKNDLLYAIVDGAPRPFTPSATAGAPAIMLTPTP